MASDDLADLKPEHLEFAELYVGGPEHLAGNATRCYQHVYGCSDSAAESGGHRLLRHDGVRARVRELREEAAEAAKDRLRKWWELAPEAQATLLKAARGEYAADDDNGRVRIQAAQRILDRAMGTPREMHRLEVEHSGITVRVAGAPHAPQEEDGGGRRVIEARSSPDGGDGRDGGEEEAPGPYAGLLEEVESAGL